MAKRMYDINDENIEITKLIKHDSESINCQTVDSDTLNKIRNFDLKKRKKLGTKKVIAICTSVAACVAVAVVALVWNNISIYLQSQLRSSQKWHLLIQKYIVV